MKKMVSSLICLFLVMAITACSNPKKESEKVELTISAAASMKEALTELQGLYEKEHQNVKLFFNFGSSGALQQQIAQGAPVDLFFSAAEDKFNELVEKGIITKQESITLVGNELVLIQNKNNVKLTDFHDLTQPSVKRISVGTPEIVPAGKYAKETLDHLKLWDKLESKMIFAKDVRQVLTYVETGNVEAGIVYKTDALVSSKVQIVSIADESSHSPIVYPLGIIKDSKHKKEAKGLFEFLQSDKAINIFNDYGFQSMVK